MSNKISIHPVRMFIIDTTFPFNKSAAKCIVNAMKDYLLLCSKSREFEAVIGLLLAGHFVDVIIPITVVAEAKLPQLTASIETLVSYDIARAASSLDGSLNQGFGMFRKYQRSSVDAQTKTLEITVLTCHPTATIIQSILPCCNRLQLGGALFTTLNVLGLKVAEDDIAMLIPEELPIVDLETTDQHTTAGFPSYIRDIQLESNSQILELYLRKLLQDYKNHREDVRLLFSSLNKVIKCDIRHSSAEGMLGLANTRKESMANAVWVAKSFVRLSGIAEHSLSGNPFYLLPTTADSLAVDNDYDSSDNHYIFTSVFAELLNDDCGLVTEDSDNNVFHILIPMKGLKDQRAEIVVLARSLLAGESIIPLPFPKPNCGPAVSFERKTMLNDDVRRFIASCSVDDHANPLVYKTGRWVSLLEQVGKLSAKQSRTASLTEKLTNVRSKKQPSQSSTLTSIVKQTPKKSVPRKRPQKDDLVDAFGIETVATNNRPTLNLSDTIVFESDDESVPPPLGRRLQMQFKMKRSS